MVTGLFNFSRKKRKASFNFSSFHARNIQKQKLLSCILGKLYRAYPANFYMKPVTKPICMQEFPNQHFGLRVVAFYPAHVIASYFYVMHPPLRAGQASAMPIKLMLAACSKQLQNFSYFVLCSLFKTYCKHCVATKEISYWQAGSLWLLCKR